MSELTPQTTHYIVHSTCIDPEPDSTFGTSPPYYDLATAIKGAHYEIRARRRAFVTARDRNGSIIAVIPVIDYPIAKETHVPGHAQGAISALFEAMEWTI